MLCGIDNILQNIPHIHIEMGIFHIILSVPQNVAMGLNDVMRGEKETYDWFIGVSSYQTNFDR